MVGADEKKEIVERRGIDVFARFLGTLIFIAINGFVFLVVGYIYIEEKFYLS